MALIDDFKTKFPEFDSADVDAAWASLDGEWQCYFGYGYGSAACNDQAILYLIAHLYSSNTTGNSPTKDVMSKTVGSVSVSYAQAKENDRFSLFFGSTKYGQRFLMLTNRLAVGGYFV